MECSAKSPQYNVQKTCFPSIRIEQLLVIKLPGISHFTEMTLKMFLLFIIIITNLSLM